MTFEWRRSAPISITIPGPPKALERNRHRIVTTRAGGQFVANYLPAKSRAEQSTIRAFAGKTMGDRPPIDGPVDIRIVAYLPIPRSWSKRDQAAAAEDRIRPTPKPDLSNLIKQIEDGMAAIVFRDDALITDMAAWKRYSITPRVVIEVRALTCVEVAEPVLLECVA